MPHTHKRLYKYCAPPTQSASVTSILNAATDDNTIHKTCDVVTS